jgi:serine/threonine protein kinase
MNPALQELYSQLQQHAITADEFGAGLSELCRISPALNNQACALIRTAMTARMLPTTTGAQLLESLQPNQPAPTRTAAMDTPSTMSDVFTSSPQTTAPPFTAAAAEGVANPASSNASALSDALASSDTPAATVRVATSPPTTIEIGPMPLGPGSLIKDRFLLQAQVGMGGMGTVFKAIDQRKTEARDPNPLVAIKVLNPELSQHANSFIVLQREARKAQELAHPNIITVYDFDRDGDIVFMTMEFLEGVSLDSFIHDVRGRGADKEVALAVIRGISEGLAYAHRKGIVHSDLKPANIFLCKYNTPKLLDFGVARAMPESTRFAKDAFDAGALGAYTLPYATEEMIAGMSPHPADDLYALGLIAYELLAGEHPFKRIFAAEAREKGLKPKRIPGLSIEEWMAIESCLSFDRARRPADAGAFLKQLTNAMQTTEKPRSRRGLYAASAVLLTAVVSFAYSGLRSPPPEDPAIQSSALRQDGSPTAVGGSKQTSPEDEANTKPDATSTTPDVNSDAASNDRPHNTPEDIQNSSIARANPIVGEVEHVAVTSIGQGPTLQAAVDQALQLAVEQINGKSIDSSSTQFQGGLAASFGQDAVQLASASFANYVTTRSRGTVTDFRIASQRPLTSGYEVTIRANVAKFIRPGSANRLRVVVAPLRINSKSFAIDNKRVSAQNVSAKIHKNISDALIQTNRVAVLDREFSAELDSEVDVIVSGKSTGEDQSRLGQQLVADYVLVGTLDKFEYQRHERKLRLTEKSLVSHSGRASLSLRLINAATRQVDFGGTVSVDIPETTPTTLRPALENVGAVDPAQQREEVLEKLVTQLSQQSIGKVMRRLYPVTVLTVEGDDVVLSQGEGQMHAGKTYGVILRGKELKDPQTGQVLGRVEKNCCTILVEKVTPSLSYGKIASRDVDVASVFAPGALEIGEPVNASGSNAHGAVTKRPAAVSTNNAVTNTKPESKPAANKQESNW